MLIRKVWFIALVLIKLWIPSFAAVLAALYGLLTFRDSGSENQKGIKSPVEHT